MSSSTDNLAIEKQLAIFEYALRKFGPTSPEVLELLALVDKAGQLELKTKIYLVLKNASPPEKRFPLQDGGGTIPWSAAEKAYLSYSRRYGNSQTLERLAERGGFGIAEFAVLYYDGPHWMATKQEPRWNDAGKFILNALRELGDTWEFPPCQ